MGNNFSTAIPPPKVKLVRQTACSTDCNQSHSKLDKQRIQGPFSDELFFQDNTRLSKGPFSYESFFQNNTRLSKGPFSFESFFQNDKRLLIGPFSV